MAVAGEAGRDDELTLARATGDRRLAGIALEPVGRREHLRMVADLTGHPGGEPITEAGKAQVDLAARELLTLYVGTWLASAARLRSPQEQFAHSPLPGPAL